MQIANAISISLTMLLVYSDCALFQLCKSVKKKEEFSELERKCGEEEKRLREKIQNLNDQYQNLQQDIEKKQAFAETVEQMMEERIQRAKEHTAEFVGEMAFLNHFITPIDSTMNGQKGNTEKQPGVMALSSPVAMPSDILEEFDDWNGALEIITMALEDAGVVPKYGKAVAAYLYAAYLNHFPILLAGPNAAQIADAFSIGLFGMTASALDFENGYDPQALIELEADVSSPLHNTDVPVKLLHVMDGVTTSKIPDIVSSIKNTSFIIHPFAEDIQIEPKSLFNYVLPLFTEIIVERRPIQPTIGGKMSGKYKAFGGTHSSRPVVPKIDGIHMNALIENNFHIILSDMKAILNGDSIDYAVLLCVLPYSYATMQIEILIETLRNEMTIKNKCSKNLLDDIIKLYGAKE